MNERIRELYLQAHSIRHYDGDPMREGNPHTVYWQGEVSAHRFTELIIQECGNALSPMLRDMISRGQAYELIKKHFGVEK